MPAANNALLQVEFAQNPVAMMALTDSGDHKKFKSNQKFWSKMEGFEPVVLANGIRSGGQITSEGTNNKVLVAEVELNLNGAIETVAGDDVTIARPAADKVKKSSVTVNAAGAFAAVAGIDGDTFSDTRGANGGPPLIPVDSVEIGQVWFDDDAAAVVAEDEIHQVSNLHKEMASFPFNQIDYYEGSTSFADALPLIHTGTIAKAVWASFATPVFGKVDNADAFQPPRQTTTLNSTPTYDGARGSQSSSLNAGQFTALLEDGIIDPIMSPNVLGKTLWIRFYPNKSITSRYDVCQGAISVSDQYPSAANITGTFTITSDTAAIAVGA